MPIRANWIISVYLLIPHICSWGGELGGVGEAVLDKEKKRGISHRGFVGVFSQWDLMPARQSPGNRRCGARAEEKEKDKGLSILDYTPPNTDCTL